MSLDRLFPVSARFNLFVSSLPRHPPLDFFPFLSVGSAKVENFSQLPNKIIFIFSFPFSFCFSIFRFFRRLPVPSEPGCKGSDLFLFRKFILK
jgi:hypothetical protein